MLGSLRGSSSSPERCPGEPMPADDCVRVPGLARASANSSPIDFAGTPGWTTRTFGISATIEIAVKSLTGSCRNLV